MISKNLGEYSEKKGFSSIEILKLKSFIYLLREENGMPLNIRKIGRTRKILKYCSSCGCINKIRLVDFLHSKSQKCRSCWRRGNENPAKQDYVREKLSNVKKDLSYLTPQWRKKFSKNRIGSKNPKYGKKDSSKTRRKKRLAAIKHIKRRIKNGGQLTPGYNLDACKLIDEYGKEHGYNFQHAENGGEFYIRELGYWLDGYDKEKNTVIEVDEKHHYNKDGKLSEKDINRQIEIENFLKCKFLRVRI